jgi:hypothetical protein
VYGFTETLVTEFERGEPYSVDIGFLSGISGIDEYIQLNIELQLGTASK